MGGAKNSYKEIFKSTSIFGGVQVLNILLTIIRSKFIAVFLGPAGMGVVGLFNSTTGLITNLTGFGLGTSAVKNVAEAHEKDNPEEVAKIVSVLRRVVWATGILGLLFTLIFSNWLSKITFGNTNYTFGFVLISFTLLITQISVGQTVILRGMRKIKDLAKASAIGSLIGLITSIPLYYCFKEQGIVPAIIITSVATLAVSWFYSRKIAILHYSPKKSFVISEGNKMLKMGFLISLSNLTTLGGSFLVRIYINKYGGVDDVGYYVAGFSLISNYVAIILSSMSTDYYPRLASVSGDNSKCRREINQQSEIAILILAPIICVFFVFSKWAVVLLYSDEFLPISTMLLWAGLGVLFKTLSWAIAFIFLAKGGGKVYFWNELIANVYMLGLNIAGFRFFGLTGLGVSFLISYILYFIQVFLISRRIYNFSFESKLVQIFGVLFLFSLICFSAQFLAPLLAYTIGCIMIALSGYYSFTELNKRVGISSFFKRKNDV